MAEDTRTSVVVSHLDVVYEVFGAKKGAASTSSRGLVDRVLRRGDDHVGHVQRIHAVKDVSFTARHGESIGIIGRNGSGKSTLLRAIAGLIPPAAGEVHLAGTPALLGVNAVLMPELTGERNIMIGGQALGLSPRTIRERFDDIVEFSGIGDFVYLPMKAYSSGMGARLRFAISTATVPDILMVDEALATGDADFKARSAERIKEIRDAAGTVFLVSHSNAHIRQMCTRALWMDQGRLIADGPAKEVVDLYQKTFAKPKPKPAAKAPAKPAAKAPAKPAAKPAAKNPAPPAQKTPGEPARAEAPES